ncbi:MAG: ribonuclease J [Gammaproteobacteria bacterium]|nr:ribonuclease J [Gammaproteobacteria bacterium]
MPFPSDLTPGSKDVWFLPLGGTGEIGMNMNLYGHHGQWLMVDCGVMFDKTNLQADGSNSVVSADPHFIAMRRQRLVGMVITHAHEDHVGAVPYLWRELKCPVYTTPFTAEILRRKLAEFDLLDSVPIIEVASGDRQQIGHFEIEWLAITHSLPEPHALLLSAGDTRIFHTADWKLDPDPVLGQAFDARPFQQLASRKVNAMVCDSTNAVVPGHSISEGQCFDGLLHLVRQAKGRVIVACFGSNVARLITLARIADHTGRYMALYGRSLRNMVSAARRTNHWPSDARVADGRHLGYLPRAEVLGVATGSQGEARAALKRMAMGDFRDLDLDPGDTVIFSSKVIPGNEDAVASLIAQLRQREVTVIEAADSELPIHASGHPCQDELRQLYGWVQPQVAIPVHGTPDHIDANAAIAREVGVTKQILGQNGDLFRLAPQVGIKRKAVKVGRLLHDRN